MKGIAALDQFTPGTNMKSWLFTIMRNTFNTRIKAYVREAPGALHCISENSVMMASQEWSLKAGELKLAIQRLPQQQREALILIGLLGSSYEDAAEICGCALGTVKSRLNRARSKLLEELKEESSHSLFETPSVESGSSHRTIGRH